MATKSIFKFEDPDSKILKSLTAVLMRSSVDDLRSASVFLRKHLKNHRFQYSAPARHKAAFEKCASSVNVLKGDFCTFIAICLGTRANFMYFYSAMSTPVRQLCELMCLFGEVEYSAVFEAIPELEGARSWDGISDKYKDEAYLFTSLHDSRYWHRYICEFPDQLGALVWSYIRPDDYNVINGARDLPEKKYETGFNFESTVGNVLQAFLWAWKGGVKTTKAGLPTLPAIKKLQPETGIEEFYPDIKKGPGAFQRSIDMAMLFSRWYEYQKKKDFLVPDAEMVKKIWEYALKNHLYQIGSAILLPEYKNSNTTTEVTHQFAAYIGGSVTLQQLDHLKLQDNWIATESLVKVFYWNESFRTICSRYLYNAGGITDTAAERTIAPEAHIKTILRECVNNYVALMSAWGLAECAFDTDDDVNPSFDIRHYRLTDLGRYVFGYSKEYTLSTSASSGPEWYADPDRTLLVAKVDSPSSLPVISQLGKKITDRRYLIDAATIMTASKDEKDISNAVEVLKRIIGEEVPEIWKKLFEDVERRKSIKVSEPDAWMMIQLPKEDHNLLRQCAADPDISEVAVKCEGARLMVKRKDYPRLLRAFKALGYMTDFSYDDWQHLPHYIYT